MQKKMTRRILSMVFGISLFVFFLGNGVQTGWPSGNIQEESFGEKTSESWMGIYIKGIKVGYSHSQEFTFLKRGQKYRKTANESWMRVSRLGGNPVEIKTVEETLHDESNKPLEAMIKTKMSESESVIQASIYPDKILFRSGEKLIKKLAYEESFFLGVPLKKIIEEKGLREGKEYEFKILDPFSYSLTDCHFEVIGEEEVMILGKKMHLWHVKTESKYIIPLTTDEWIDEKGECWKSVSQTSFLTTTSLRMSEEAAIAISGENFDIAYSSLIKSNVILENPQQVQRMTLKLSGIYSQKIKDFPFDDGSQKILEFKKDYAIIQTSSQIISEKEAIPFPIKDEKYQKYLRSTTFCQSDDPEIVEVARRIVDEERNSWRAAKKIAEWVNKEMTPNYDVGFASAKEILKNREGDCSEHTVLAVTLSRAVGIPARAAVGIMYGRGIFAYHMWPEIYVGRWIGLDAKWLAVDEKSGEYYADATHIKFGYSYLDENMFKEMAEAVSEIIGKLKLEVIDYSLEK